MGYRLGVDLGTTWTAAATWRDGRATIAPLGTNQAAIPSVVCLRPDGLVLTGDAAERRALSEPENIAREFKRRLGDATPLIIGGQPNGPERLTGLLLADVVAQVSDQEGERPEQLAIAHPANWGVHKLNLLAVAVSQAGWEPTATLTIAEPVAAATNYASQNRVAPGERICVYDLGGGTFDVAILERTANGFAVIGRPDGLEHVGGLDVDAAVFTHVTTAVADHYRQLDPADPGAVAAIARLRQECTRAKETLSADVDTVIPVHLPNHHATIRLTRAELEQFVRPALSETIEATRRTISAAGLDPADINRVLLVGGASRMPLVAQLILTDLGIEPTIDTHPKHAIALGAAIQQLPAGAAAETGPATPAAAATPVAAPPPVTAPPAEPAPAPTPPATPVEPAPTEAAPTPPPTPADFDPAKTVAAIPAHWAPPNAQPPAAPTQVVGDTPGQAPEAAAQASPGGPSHAPPTPDPNRPRPPDPPGAGAAQPARPPDPPAQPPADGKTQVIDPSPTPPRSAATPSPPFVAGSDNATSVFDPSSTTVFDPAAAQAKAGEALIRSKAGSTPAPNPDATTVSPRPQLPTPPPDDGPNRRTLLISLIVAMVLAGGLLLVVRPFERFDSADPPASTTSSTTAGPDTETDTTPEPTELATVPDLIGEPADRAEIRLLALGFAVEVEQERRSNEPAGTVIDQSVVGGEQTEAGATITLTVSAGRAALVVPDLIGLTNAQAAAEIRDIGFDDITVEREPSQTVASGVVLRVEPAAGTAVELDTPIVVVLSDGVAIATIPDVVDLTGTEAEAALMAAGFDVEVTTVDVDGGSDQDGRVISQSPTPGGQRVLPATVSIEVGQGN